ncbi:exodeoxyribonuclease V subunit alpha [Methylocaldum sp.]|uniref:exodeoxyribonuclease V subunit alpha n=1 Tax=Methylocaldum sp. TaxID=1969727 RepID=UPI002D6C490A|nr:exodeoxyribonuclease V subunit alpha [Methylocaldum sp.]HYE36061.1 exodeoxyribonuclease V subunit alpha [Methylocaldum sp.]
MNTEARAASLRSSARALQAKPSSAAPKLLKLSPLGKQFAAYLRRLDGAPDEAVTWAAQLVYQAVAEGHVCIRLDDYAGSEIVVGDGDAVIKLPDLADWLALLRKCTLVAEPGGFAPLILDAGNRLYLARYWQYEKTLADNLMALAESPCPEIDLAKLRCELDRLFAHNTDLPDRQKLAAAVAALRRFCVISGGPGTGKTSTVVRILAALQSQSGEKPLRMALSAPTGKAAARLQEAIREQKVKLSLPQAVLDALPETAFTLHRLLGAKPDSVYFRHNRNNPLPVDVLVVDEASMIDLALMAKLIDALPGKARLILLGDKDQLASVEAGAVFGDLCESSGYSTAFCDQLYAASGVKIPSGNLFIPALSDCVALLTYSHRFGSESGIGQLARMINGGRAKEAVELLASGRHPEIHWERTRTGGKADLVHRMESGYHAFFAAVDSGTEPKDILRLFGRFRVLTAHREGDSGAAGINRLFEEQLFARKRLRWGSRWYPGRPVIVTRNDYDLRLFNGDIGIALETGSGLRVFFEDADGHIRGFAPARLPEHETVYAMTVHKSQGSEFDEIVLALPDLESPVLDRPLIYTAITRARHRAEIRGSQKILEDAIKRVPNRSSGLRERLWTYI